MRNDEGLRQGLYATLMMTKMRELQRKPTFAEVKEDVRMPHPNNYSFYWGSFDEAVDEIWQKLNPQVRSAVIVRRFDQKGGDKMAKKEKVWPHTYEELMDLAVQKCVESGKMPSRRAWIRDDFLDFEEIVAVLGKGGGWDKAAMRIEWAWQSRTRKARQEETKETMVVAELPVTEVPVEVPAVLETEAPALETSVVEERQTEESVVESQRPVVAAAQKRPPRFTKEELIAALRAIQRDYDLGEMVPSYSHIQRYHKEHPETCPTYMTFTSRFGAPQMWAGLLLQTATTDQTPAEQVVETLVTPEAVAAPGAVESSTQGKPVEKTLEVAEVPGVPEAAGAPQIPQASEVDVVVHAVRLDLTVNGQRQVVNLRFG